MDGRGNFEVKLPRPSPVAQGRATLLRINEPIGFPSCTDYNDAILF